jgi:hypothetical protein
MEQLGLEITGPSPYVINMANQLSESPLGQISGCKINTGGEDYVITFQVLRMHSNKNSFPLLLGRPWLRAAQAKVDWGGRRPHIIYGPETNPTKVYIQPNFPRGSELVVSPSEPEAHSPTKVTKRIEGAKLTLPRVANSTSPPPLSCLGPNLYEWEDDREFTAWLAEHSHSEPEWVMDAFFMEGVDCAPTKDVGSAILLDDILYEDICEVTVDGTQPFDEDLS